MSLLRYLVEELQKEKVDFYFLVDSRCGDEFKSLPIVEYRDASLSARKAFYKQHKNDFSSILCFGNVPPPIKLHVPVFTYFHNINMLTLSDCKNKKQLVKFWLKRLYIKTKKNNTSCWLVQTSNTLNELTKHLSVSVEKIKLFPFYKLPCFPASTTQRTDYIFVGEYSGSKGHDELLDAWRILHESGVDIALHMTVSIGEVFLERIQKSLAQGVHIINHGFIPMEELAQLYMKCKATVYPSHNESFGLGLVEAMEAGCDVVAADLPYVHAICTPSEVFNPFSPESIAQSVLRYEKGDSPRTIKRVSDTIEELVNLVLNR